MLPFHSRNWTLERRYPARLDHLAAFVQMLFERSGLLMCYRFTCTFYPLDRPPLVLKSTSPRSPEPHFSFELTGKRGAALATKYPTYWEDSPLEGAFESYTRRHYDSWVTFARDKQYGDVQPVLVSGFDVTGDFSLVAYSNEDKNLEVDLSVGPSVSLHWGTWYSTPKRLLHTNHGSMRGNPLSPRLIDAGSIPDDFNQYVFIRYYTMRPRKWMPMPSKDVLRVGAGQRDSGSGGNGRGIFPGWMVRSSAKPTTSGGSNLGGRRGSTTDDTALETGTAARSASHVWFSLCSFV